VLQPYGDADEKSCLIEAEGRSFVGPSCRKGTLLKRLRKLLQSKGSPSETRFVTALAVKSAHLQVMDIECGGDKIALHHEAERAASQEAVLAKSNDQALSTFYAQEVGRRQNCESEIAHLQQKLQQVVPRKRYM